MFLDTHKEVYLSKDLFDKKEMMGVQGVNFYLNTSLKSGDWYAVGKRDVLHQGMLWDKRQWTLDLPEKVYE